jgi:cell division protein FtsL
MKAMRTAVPALDAPAKSPRLRVLDSKQSSRTPAATVGAVLVVLLFVALFGIVAFQAFLVQTQGHLDDANNRVSTEEARAKDLRRQAAELSAPDRVIAAARDRLGLIVPGDVAYLEPQASDDATAAFDPVRDKTPAPTVPAPMTPKATTPTTAPKTPATAVPKATVPTSPATTVPKATTPTPKPKPTPTTAPTSSATTVPKATTPTTMRGR